MYSNQTEQPGLSPESRGACLSASTAPQLGVSALRPRAAGTREGRAKPADQEGGSNLLEEEAKGMYK